MAKRIDGNQELAQSEIKDDDVLLIQHDINISNVDRKLKIKTLFNWIKSKFDSLFASKEAFSDAETRLGTAETKIKALEEAEVFPAPEGEGKLLVSTQTEWTQVNKDEVGEVTLKMTKAEWESYDKSQLKNKQSVIITDDNEELKKIIDDTAVTNSNTWSAEKINNSLVGKAKKSILHQPVKPNETFTLDNDCVVLLVDWWNSNVKNTSLISIIPKQNLSKWYLGTSTTDYITISGNTFTSHCSSGIYLHIVEIF